MPRKYCRKFCKPRATWTEEALIEAMEKVQSGEISKREAERRYKIPARTLGRRIETGRSEKGRLGPDCKFFFNDVKISS